MVLISLLHVGWLCVAGRIASRPWGSWLGAHINEHRGICMQDKAEFPSGQFLLKVCDSSFSMDFRIVP